MKLHLAENLSLPIETVTQTFAYLAKRGAGKTYSASVLAEEMLKAGQQIVALDPTGAWWGLRSGYPILVAGGEHGDLPLEENAGEILASAIVENRLSAVIDFGLMRKGQITRFMVAFAETLYRLNREPLHLFVDEADAFAPQGRNYSGGEDNRLLGAMEDIVRRGRKRGIGCSLITQRPAVLNKNVLTQCESLFTFRLGHPRDIDAVMEWVHVHADETQAKEMLDSLPTLNVGETWFWSPGWLGTMKRVQIRKRETFDSSATPKPGQTIRAPKSLQPIDVAALGDKIKATVTKAKENDPAELRRQLAALKKQVADLEKRPAVAAPAPKVERVEVPVLKNGQLDKALSVIERLRGIVEPLAAAIGAATKPAPIIPQKAVLIPQKAAFIPKPARIIPERPVSIPGEPAGKLDKCARAILSVLATHGPCDSGRLTLLSGYRYSGGFKNALSALRQAGFIQGGNTGLMEITEAGRESGQFDELPTGEALRDYWLNHRSFDKCSRAILEALLAVWPGSLTAEELCERTGYQYSGGFKNALSALRTAGVLVGRNTEAMQASQELFE